MYAWFVKRAVPNDYFQTAKNNGQTLFEYLEDVAEQIPPGQTGLIALDWWNGNRSILADADLTGVLVGMTLSTKPEDIYRALLESTAFGTRRIVENFREHGVHLKELVACGGIVLKSPLLMQIYADVCGLPVTVRSSAEIPARGAALFGAVAAGKEAGGFNTIQEASSVLAPPIGRIYRPNAAATNVYDAAYEVYRELYDYFGRDNSQLLHRIKSIRTESFRKSGQ